MEEWRRQNFERLGEEKDAQRGSPHARHGPIWIWVFGPKYLGL